MSFKFNPITGKLDLVNNDTSVVTALTKEASETISALRAVTAIDKDTIELADNATYEDSQVLGISVTAGTAGQDIEYVEFGEIQDASFTFTVNEPLYLGSNGVITNTPPTTGFVTKIGYGLGPGAIFVDNGEQIELC